MPVESCKVGDKPGYRYGSKGKCYTYTANDKSSQSVAFSKAVKQGQAIKARGSE